MIGETGPCNLTRSLDPIWPEDRPHVSVDRVRDSFATLVYLPRLRDEATLDGALQRLVEDMASPYAYASGFDEQTGANEGVIDGKAMLPGSLAGGLLVRREAVHAEEARPVSDEPGSTAETHDGSRPTPERPGAEPARTEPLPGRFFATVPIEPERAGLEVARIMDGLLVELTRSPGSTLRLTLEIDGTVADPCSPQNVVDTVKANARDLNLHPRSFGFEEE